MTSQPYIYKGRCVSVANGQYRVLVPQVLSDQQALLHGWIGDAPVPQTDGLIQFLGGDPSFPVWLGAFVPATQ